MDIQNLFENFFPLEDENSFSDYSILNNNPQSIISLDEFCDVNGCYPFSPRKGLECYELYNSRFDITKKTVEKQRKEKEDNIRKKIKANFHKKLKKIINNLLNESGAKYTFETLPQIFISDISQKTNFEVLNLTYEEIFDYSYQKIINENPKKPLPYIIQRNEASLKKYNKNKETLDYLNSNPLISDKSGWNKIKSMKYIDLLNAYFNSDEFVQTIHKLYKKEKQNYINQYIFFAKTYVTFFQSYKSNSIPEKNNVSNTSIPFETNYSNEIQLSLYQSNNNDNSKQNS